IDQQGRPPPRCVNLMFEVECRSLLSVGPSVNVYNQRVFRRRCHSQRFRNKGFDSELVVVADKSERLDFRNLLAAEDICIQVGDLLRESARALKVKLRQVTWARQSVSDSVVPRHRPRPDRAAVANDCLGSATCNGQSIQSNSASVLSGKVDEPAVGGPAGRALAVIYHRADLAAVAS